MHAGLELQMTFKVNNDLSRRRIRNSMKLIKLRVVYETFHEQNIVIKDGKVNFMVMNPPRSREIYTGFYKGIEFHPWSSV